MKPKQLAFQETRSRGIYRTLTTRGNDAPTIGLCATLISGTNPNFGATLTWSTLHGESFHQWTSSSHMADTFAASPIALLRTLTPLSLLSAIVGTWQPTLLRIFNKSCNGSPVGVRGQRGDRKIQGHQKMCRDRGSNSGLRPPAPLTARPPQHDTTGPRHRAFVQGVPGFLLQILPWSLLLVASRLKITHQTSVGRILLENRAQMIDPV